MLKNFLLIFMLTLTLLLTGCGGGDTTVQASNTTMGQELQDLDATFKKGIITEREYKRAKDDILDKYKY